MTPKWAYLTFRHTVDGLEMYANYDLVGIVTKLDRVSDYQSKMTVLISHDMTAARSAHPSEEEMRP